MTNYKPFLKAFRTHSLYIVKASVLFLVRLLIVALTLDILKVNSGFGVIAVVLACGAVFGFLGLSNKARQSVKPEVSPALPDVPPIAPAEPIAIGELPYPQELQRPPELIQPKEV
ncbi:hypothetical protein FACS189490_07930 [Clostridia bacterium]|nr:hypothetical protein FACS189490_07930 [Clostridia bacterium]